MQHHRRADADRDAFDRGNERRFASSESLDECESRKFSRLRSCFEKIRDIVARREHPARPGKHDGADGRIAVSLPQACVAAIYIARLSAFFLSGRSKVTQRTAPSR